MLPSRASIWASLICYGIEIFSSFNLQVVELFCLFHMSCSSLQHSSLLVYEQRQRNWESKRNRWKERIQKHFKHQLKHKCGCIGTCIKDCPSYLHKSELFLKQKKILYRLANSKYLGQLILDCYEEYFINTYP